MKTLDDFDRLELGIFPTPLYKLENLSRLTGRNIYVKRDDMTGVALGGNKVRKLEYLLADAKRHGAQVVITTGGAQSNHAMLTAACCNRVGLTPLLVLKAPLNTPKRGNLILNDILGARVHLVEADGYDAVYSEIGRIVNKLRSFGQEPYTIPVGGSVPLGSLGYVRCVREIAEQARAMDVRIDHIVCTAGSGGTHAGVALGSQIYLGSKVTGIAVSGDDFVPIVRELIKDTAALLGKMTDITPNVFNYMGAGYAIPSAQGSAAIRTVAKAEGLILDPVYTGKCMAGMLDLIKKGYFAPEENILFLHTGGAGGVFAIDV